MNASQPQTRSRYIPPRLVTCTPETNIRGDAWDIRPDVDIAVVIPARQEIIVRVFDEEITFKCTTPYDMIEVLIGLGFYKGTLAVPDHLVDFASSQQYTLEK